MCTTCGILGCITFPNFVGQSCCNPCCREAEDSAVAGVSTNVNNGGCQNQNCCSCGCHHSCGCHRPCGCGGSNCGG